MKKLVSIIIPAYNVEEYIGETIESILWQSYSTIEIIIVNDGSTDKTREIISSYAQKDSRIIVVDQENRGLSGARNTGLRSAKGEYLCIFDADDIMLPKKIAIQKEFLDSHPACDVVYSVAYHFLDKNKKVYLWFPPLQSDDLYKDLLTYGNFINPNVVFFRKSVFKKYGGFDENIRSAEDWEYWLALSYQGVQFSYLSEPLTLYRIRSSGLSGNRVRICSTAVYVLQKQKKLSQTPERSMALKKVLQAWRLRLLVAYLQAGQWENAKPMIRYGMPFKAIYSIYYFFPKIIISSLYRLMLFFRFAFKFERSKNKSIEELISE